MNTKLPRKATALAILALTAGLLTGCSDDHETDANPCGDTGKPVTQFDGGSTGSFDAERSAFVEKAGGGGGGGGKGGSGSSGGSKSGGSTSKSSSSSSGSKSIFGGSSAPSKASVGSTAFSGSKVTGSRTFTAPSGTKYAVAPRTTMPYRPMYSMSPPPVVANPGMHYNYLWWAIYGNYPGATTIIECR